MLEKVTNSMLALAQNRYLRAIRDGIIATLPIIIVGSIFLIVAFMPFPSDWKIKIWAAKNTAKILLPYRMSMFIMTIYAIVGIGHSLAKSYGLDTLSGSIIALTGYLATIVPEIISEIYVVDVTTAGETIQQVANKATEGAYLIQKGFWAAPMGNLGSAGLFVGMIVAILSVEIYRFTTTRHITIKMPEAVPASVARSFEALVPTFIVLILVSTVTYWLGIDLHGIMAMIMKPIVKATDSIFSVWVLVLLITLFWSLGISGVAIIGTLARPIWLVLLDENTAAVASGSIAPNIAPEQFYQWFIWIGGSGATIGLAFLLAFWAKSTYAKTLGKVAFVPAVFNINEPIIFGTPIVLNPILIIPFILAPMVNATIAYIAVSTGLVSRLIVNPPWTLPGPIGAFMATGGDFRAIILNILLCILSIIIYYPFFKKFDGQLLKEEQGA